MERYRQTKGKIRRIAIASLACIAFILFAILVACGICNQPIGRLVCTETYIDKNNANIKRVRYLLFFETTSVLEENFVSQYAISQTQEPNPEKTGWYFGSRVSPIPLCSSETSALRIIEAIYVAEALNIAHPAEANARADYILKSTRNGNFSEVQKLQNAK
jgi:hypothetical protein